MIFSRLINSCYSFNSRFVCVPALAYCNSQLYGPLMRKNIPLLKNLLSHSNDLYPELGLNPYDVRRKCDRAKDGDLCYPEMDHVAVWMNQPQNKVSVATSFVVSE